MPKQPSIAKIARPRLTDVLPRKRLFASLDKGRHTSVTWVMGPGGSGKTTLVASWLDARKLPCLWYQLDDGDSDIASFFYYLGLAAKKAAPQSKKPLPLLTAEYLGDVPTFTRRYIESLCSRIKSPFTIVFDNYHHLPVSSPFHGVMRDTLSAIPEGIEVVINSRAAPPPSLALLSTYGKIHVIGWDELQFDKDETGALLRSIQKKEPDKELLTRVHSMTTGWAAGLVLLMKRLPDGAVGPREAEGFEPRAFFDYFATEHFEKTDRETQSFLLKTSFLPRMVPKVAAMLTDNAGAGQLLEQLSRNHFFTERRSLEDPVYQYHPIFREFLLARARESYPAAEVRDIQRRGAELTEQAGQLEDAAKLYRLSKSWNGLARLITLNARSLLSQGRYAVLEEWIKSLPFGELAKDPWLLYWMGACRMPLHLPEGHHYFERALTLFRKRNDAAGVFLAWSGAIESLVQEMGDIKRLDSWVALIFELMKKYAFPSQEIEDEVTARIFTAMPWVPSDSNFVKWRKRAMELIERDADASLRLTTAFYLLGHFIWIGDYGAGRVVLDVVYRMTKMQERVSPLAYLMGRMCEGWFLWLTGDHERCYSIVQDILAKANESGVHIWDRNILQIGVASKMCSGDLSQAKIMLDKMGEGIDTARLFDRFYYYHDLAWYSMLTGDVPVALAHMNKAEDIAAKTGFPINVSEAHFGKGLVLNTLGDRKNARLYATAHHAVGRKMGSSLVEYKALLLDAVIAFEEDREQYGLSYLRKAMALAKERGFVYTKWWLPSMMMTLFVKALEAGIESEYVAGLIRKCGIVPDEPPLHLETWPWPVRIYTLGRFKVLLDDKPVAFTGKVQKKPLEMLKALIAFGESDVSEERILDALWPDADGDTARISFKTTLHRLRQFIGNENVIAVQDGRVSLDRRICWTDVRAFERMLEEPPRDLVAQSPRTRSLERALLLYHGHFLSADEDKPWAVSLREQLKRKFVQAVNKIGESAEEAKEWKKAIAAYERGLEVDAFAEEFYQRLMACYLKLGRRADAIKIYNRCKKVFAANLGIGPSEETRRMYSSIRRKGERAW